jgi:hypothetical protein
MIPKPSIKHFIYAAVIIISLIILTLVAIAPGFMDTGVVYQGF